MKITLVLHNIRSTYNVGAILRTAEGLGIEEVALSGYTPRYNDAKLLPHLREKLSHQIAKSALGAEKLVKQTPVDDLRAWISEKHDSNWLIAGLENNLSAEDEERKIVLGSQGFYLSPQRQPLPRPSARGGRSALAARSRFYCLAQKDKSPADSNTGLVLILGEEVNGIPSESRELCDVFLELPMVGCKESYNVSVATAMALWELKRQDF